ncbi:MAG: serine hydrolase [Planctomycetia bacterium]|nr:serine hydrolase [Planctomycetia bacterium]
MPKQSRREFIGSAGAFIGLASHRRWLLADDVPPLSTTGPIPTTGQTTEELKPLDEMITGFLAKHQLPGAALAIGRAGRLLYSRGFGWADVDEKKPVQPDSQFRLASISKSITAIAVMQAIEQGCLALDTRVLPLLRQVTTDEPVDSRWGDITIRHLLQHTGGWDRDKSFDAMFRAVEFAQESNVEPPAKPEHIIRVMLRKPLDFAPGERFAYSNFGYCLLGRVLEAVDRLSYGDSVARRVLNPLCLKRICLGRTLKKHRLADEVTYYGAKDATGPSVFSPNVGQQVPWPYGGWHLEAMGAHGGWTGSASDLVRLAMSLEPCLCSSPLNAASLTAMWSRPTGLPLVDKKGEPETTFYGCGWMVREVGGDRKKISVFHTGSLDGTSTLLVRRHDGFCWAALFNSRHGFNPESNKFDVTPSNVIDPLIHQAVDAVAQWSADGNG